MTNKKGYISKKLINVIQFVWKNTDKLLNISGFLLINDIDIIGHPTLLNHMGRQVKSKEQLQINISIDIQVCNILQFSLQNIKT